MTPRILFKPYLKLQMTQGKLAKHLWAGDAIGVYLQAPKISNAELQQPLHPWPQALQDAMHYGIISIVAWEELQHLQQHHKNEAWLQLAERR